MVVVARPMVAARLLLGAGRRLSLAEEEEEEEEEGDDDDEAISRGRLWGLAKVENHADGPSALRSSMRAARACGPEEREEARALVIIIASALESFLSSAHGLAAASMRYRALKRTTKQNHASVSWTRRSP